MKISIISTLASNWGGSELLFVSLVEEALIKGFKVQLVVNKANTQHKLIKKAITKVTSTVVTPIDDATTHILKKGIKQIRNKIAPYTLDKVNQFNPDVILINQPNSSDASFNRVYYDFLKNTQTKFYLISHFNAEHFCYSSQDIEKLKAINQKAKMVFFVSQRNKERFEHQIALKLKNSTTIANHPFIKKFTYQPFPKINGTVQFASVARFECNFKGQDILLQTLSSSKWKQRNWVLNLYGTGPDEDYLKELVNFYNIKDKVNFCGQVNDINKVWQQNHILLMPSLGEGKPLALEEAICCGRPAVVSNVAGNSELIKDEMNGFIASSHYADPFNKALEKAWNQKEKWEEMGKNGYTKINSYIDQNPGLSILNLIESKLNG